MKVCFKEWFKAAGIRAIRTVAQAALATIGSSAVFAEVDWRIVASSAALAAIVSLLMSIGGLPECKAKDTETDGEE